MLKGVTSLILLSAALGKKFGHHKFPHEGPKGQHYANEFQLLSPELIKVGSPLSDQYAIESVSPTVISSGEVVTVKFSSKIPFGTDAIAAYSPPDIDITTVLPIKYGWCDDDENYMTTGSGQMTFNLTNVRGDIVFYYLTNLTEHKDDAGQPVALLKSEEFVKFRNVNQPLRARVVATGDYDVFKVLWSSATSATPVMHWGTERGVYKNIVKATTDHIEKSDLCGPPATTVGWFDLGLTHTALFTGMKKLANTKIYYKFGDDATNDFSLEHEFFVPPLPGTQPPTRPTTVILYDDMGRGSTDSTYTWYEYGRATLNTVNMVGAEVKQGTVDGIYHGGDLSYASGHLPVWDFWMDMLSPVSSTVLYLTTVGNHESDAVNSASYYNTSDSGGECGVHALRFFPQPAPASIDEPWWSYDIGLMHFIGISTEHNYTKGTKQYEWLENDLKNVDRAVTPWVIFGGHRAMYINSNWGGMEVSDQVVSELMITQLEPLLWKYKVNLGFYGHNHVVQRHSAVLNKVVIQPSVLRRDDAGEINYQEDPQATVHLVIGTAGADFTINAEEPKPVWNERYFYQYGYSRLQSVNSTYLYWEWIDSSTAEVTDRVVITQKDPFAPFKL